MPLTIIHRDITKVKCEVIVDPSDSRFSGSGGADRAIHAAAGAELDAACRGLAPIRCGETAVTDGYALPSRYIIHTMGPVWRGGSENEEMLLRSCYINSLLKAKSLGVQSIAFPLISSGTFGFPKDKVLRIAADAISEFLFQIDSELEVFVCVLDRSDFEVRRASELHGYLDRFGLFPHVYDAVIENIAEEAENSIAAEPLPSLMPKGVKRSARASAFSGLSEWIKKQDKSFSEMLLDLIKQKGMKEVECYKRANVSKNTFSKIKNAGKPVPYQPSKPTVIAFAIALRLNMTETQELLKSAGFTLSHNNFFDLIIEYYISQGIYDVFEINEALYYYDQVCLGC